MGYTTTMHYFTQYPLWVRALALPISIALIGAFIHISQAKEPAEDARVATLPELFTPEASQMFGYAVSGVIEARESITVRALTGGTITERFAHEGSIVKAGDTLLLQKVPLLAERMVLQDAQNSMGILMQEASVIGRSAEKEGALVQKDAASTSVVLTESNSIAQTESATALLTTQVYGSVTSLVSALDFIDANKSHFEGKNLTEFRKTVDALYGGNRTYLSGPVQYSFHSNNDILGFLDTLTENDMYPDTATLVSIAGLVDAELDATKLVLISGEKDFLDAREVIQGGELYSSYLTYRGSVIEAQANLRILIGIARATQTGGALSTHGVNTENALRTIGYITATQIAENALKMASQSSAISGATMNILSGEEALGNPQAPFDGVIDEVFVHVGESVMPGTPLFTLVGSGAKELRVSVPETMFSYLSTGSEFTVDGNVVGYVDRFSPIFTGGSVVVVIELIDDAYAVGETLRGEIQYELMTSDSVALPRPFVYFDTEGAYVRTESYEDIRVSILHDTGKIFIVRPAKEITEKIRKSVGIRF